MSMKYQKMRNVAFRKCQQIPGDKIKQDEDRILIRAESPHSLSTKVSDKQNKIIKTVLKILQLRVGNQIHTSFM